MANPKKINNVLFLKDGTEFQLPTKLILCLHCQGTGTEVNPAIDGAGITQREFDEDPEFQDSYFVGVYDRACGRCAGSGRVYVIDIEGAQAQCPAELEAFEEQEIESMRTEQEEAWLRRAESGERY